MLYVSDDIDFIWSKMSGAVYVITHVFIEISVVN
jgi:hypothetical protein